MTWPQWVIAVYLVLHLYRSVKTCVTDRDLTSGEAAMAVMITIMIMVGVVYTLHAGRFW